MANGQEYFDAVLNDPSQMPKDIEFESLFLVAPTAYERKTGRSGDDVRDQTEVSNETCSNKGGWPPQT